MVEEKRKEEKSRKTVRIWKTEIKKNEGGKGGKDVKNEILKEDEEEERR
jgi:hypothetical protein